MNDKLDWVLFDADHTLFDFDYSSRRSLTSVLERYGYEVDDAAIDRYMEINKECWTEYEKGNYDRSMLIRTRFERFFNEYSISGVDPVAFNGEYLAELPQHPSMYEGAMQLLDAVRGSYRLGVITNGLQEVQRARLQRMALESYFEVIVISGEIGLAKPDRAYFEFAHNAMGWPSKDRVMVIGDAIYADIYGASRFGFRTCWYNPNRRVNDIGVAPDFEVRNYFDIREILSV